MDNLTHIYLSEAIRKKIDEVRDSVAQADRLGKSDLQSKENNGYFSDHAKRLKRCILELEKHIRETRPEATTPTTERESA